MADEIDVHSATWRYVAAWAAGRLTSARARLETPAIDPAATEQLRGEIAALKALAALAEPRRAYVTEKPVPYLP